MGKYDDLFEQPDTGQGGKYSDLFDEPGVVATQERPTPTIREQLTLLHPEGSDQYQNMLAELYRQQHPGVVAPLSLAEKVRQTILAPTPETPFDISGEHQVEIPYAPEDQPAGGAEEVAQRVQDIRDIPWWEEAKQGIKQTSQQMFGGDQPSLDPSDVLPDGKFKTAAAGTVKGLDEFGQELTTTDNAAIALALPASGPAAVGAATYFAWEMMKSLPDDWAAFKAAQTVEEKARIASKAVAKIGTIGLAGHHVFRELRPPSPLRTTPLEMPQLPPSGTMRPGTIAGDVSAAVNKMSDLHPSRQFTMVPEPRPQLAPAPTVEDTLARTVQPPVAPPPTQADITRRILDNRKRILNRIAELQPHAEAARKLIPGGERGMEEELAQLHAELNNRQTNPIVHAPPPETARTGVVSETARAPVIPEPLAPVTPPERAIPRPVEPARASEGGGAPPVAIPPEDARYAGVETPTTGGVATKHAATETAREDRNLSPVVQAAEQDFPTAWEKSARELQADPDIGRRLVDQYKAKPAAADDVQNAHLLRETIRRQAEYDAAVKAVNDSAHGSPENVDAQVRLAKASQDYYDVHQADRNAGTGTGRGLNARKMLADDQYNLAKMESRRRAAQGGRPLNEQQMRETVAHWNKINRLRNSLETAEREATGNRIKLKIKNNGGFIDPPTFRDIVDLGRRIYGRGMDFAQWSKEMLRHVGKVVAGHLRGMWEDLNKLYAVPPAFRRGIKMGTPEDVAATRAKETSARAGHDIAKSNYERVIAHTRPNGKGSREVNAARFRENVPRAHQSRSDIQQIHKAIGFMAGNLLKAAKSALKEPWARPASKQYQGYNKYSHTLSDDFGGRWKPETVMVTESSQSPNTSPDNSFEATRRLMKMLSKNTEDVFDERMADWARSRTTKNAQKEIVPLYDPADIAAMMGKKFSEIPVKDDLQAQWLRAFDEVYHPDKKLRVVRPDGTLGDTVKTTTGADMPFAWTPFKMIQSGVDALLEQRPVEEILHTPKVANYYMSKLLAFERSNHVVADTHHTSAAWGNSLPADHDLVAKVFKSGRDVNGEFAGYYSIVHEATLRAAKQLGMDPKEFQALIWSYQRGLKSPDVLGPGLAEVIQGLWEHAAEGKITEKEAYDGTERIARDFHGGQVPAPDYFGGRFRSEGAPTEGVSGKPAELPQGGGVSRSTVRGRGISDATGTPSGIHVSGHGTVPEAVGEGGVSGRSLRVTSPERRRAFEVGIQRTNRDHPFGAAVEVKPSEFYQNPDTKLFLSDDDLAGVAVKPDGNLVSVFKHPESKTKMGPLLAEAAENSSHLEAYSVDGFLPNLYSKFGFRPVARVKFDPEMAPANWNYEAGGRPDIVFMVRDPENKLGLPDAKASGFEAIKDQVPVAANWDKAESIQQRIVEKLKDLYKSFTGQDVLPKARVRGSVPLPTPDRYTKAYQTRLSRQTEELKRKLAAQDYTKTERTQRVLDRKTFEMRAEYQRTKTEFDRAVRRDELRNRPWLRRAADTAVKAERAIKLTGATIYGKLASAAVTRLGTRPIEQMIQSAIGQIPGLRTVHEAAPLSGFSPEAERAALGGVGKGIREFGQRLKGDYPAEEIAFGKPHIEPKSILDLPGRAHAAIKAPVQEAERARATTQLEAHARKQGLDLNDPRVKQDIGEVANQEAKRSIFMQDNFISNAWQSMIRTLEQSKTHPTAGFISSKVAQILLPIVKVPTNIALETGTHMFGTVTATAKLGQVMHRGMSTIKPEEANMIMRHYSKGMVGAGLFLTGYFLESNGQYLGGFYQPGKREEGAVAPMGARIAGVDIPSWLLHAPAFIVMQAGATAYHMAHHVNKQGEPDKSAVLGVAKGLVEEIPFMKEMGVVDNLLSDSYEGRKARGNLGTGLVIPQIVKEAAKYTDPVKEPDYRTPKNTLDYFKLGIPGLREQVPLHSDVSTAIKKHRGRSGAFAVP